MNQSNYLSFALLSVLLFTLSAIANPAASTATDVKIEVSTARRMHQVANGKESSVINIALRYSGLELAAAKAIQTTVTSATDDAGNPLQARDSFHDADGTFQRLNKPFGKGANPNVFELKLAFDGLGKTQSVKALAGNIKLVLPDKDPASIVTASFEKDAGKPINHATLKTAGVEITLQKPTGIPTGTGKINGVAYEQYDLTYQIKDPNNKVVEVELFDAAGEKLQTLHSTTMEESDKKTKSLQLKSKPPQNATAKIYLLTEKSVITVPFEFKDIALTR